MGRPEIHVGCRVTAELVGTVSGLVVVWCELTNESTEWRCDGDAKVVAADKVTEVTALVTVLVTNTRDADMATSGGARL